MSEDTALAGSKRKTREAEQIEGDGEADVC